MMGGRQGMRALFFLAILGCALGVEHNLPEGVELVDPKDLGLDSQIDLDKLLGNVKALPIDTNALSSALGKPGLKTQVLTVGFDGSEGLNLDDFELPQLKNDENGPLAAEAFKSFKNFFKNSSSASTVDDVKLGALTGGSSPFQITSNIERNIPTAGANTKVVRPGNGKRRTMMKRRKVVRVNGTTTTSAPPPPQAPSQGPKVIELDSSQIEKLIASGKIGPPKSLTPGGPQIIELGQRDLDALLSGDNAEEIKQILEGGDTLKDFDLSQISGGKSSSSSSPPQTQPPTPPQSLPPSTTYETVPNDRISESRPPLSVAQMIRSQVSSPVPTVTTSTTTTSASSSSPPSNVEESPAAAAPSVVTPIPTQSSTTTTVSLPSSETPAKATDLPIIYSYSSLNDNNNNNNNYNQQQPSQNFQGQIPLQFYSSHANGQEQARQFKTPTFEFISAPPVSFSSSVLPNLPVQQQQANQQQNNQQNTHQDQPFYVQTQQQYQNQNQVQNSFISQASSQFLSPSQIQQESSTFRPSPPEKQQQPSSSSNSNSNSNLNKFISAPQTSSHTEQLNNKPSSVNENIVPNSNTNYIQSLHKVPLPINSVKLVTPSPQTIQAVLNQVPASFQPSLMPHHIVSSPVLDPFRLSNQQQGISGGNFLRVQNSPPQEQHQQPFRNTQLFNPGSISLTSSRNQGASQPQSQPPRAIPAQSTHFRFPTTSSILNAGGPNRFRTAESSNPFFGAQRQPATNGFGNLVLNSFVAGDGLNYRPSSRDSFNQPGI
ncbi:unnamed protein product [Orchesella dallaii]|uniref:Uncharacterized protein n=1 Tax=Orchesella dallaii TaxID=48710 RepID=A0ABP1PJ86_9HEXA